MKQALYAQEVYNAIQALHPKHPIINFAFRDTRGTAPKVIFTWNSRLIPHPNDFDLIKKSIRTVIESWNQEDSDPDYLDFTISVTLTNTKFQATIIPIYSE